MRARLLVVLVPLTLALGIVPSASASPPLADPSGVRTAAAPSLPPRAMQARAFDGAVAVHWQKPWAGSPTGYRVSSYPGGRGCTMDATGRSCRIRGLTDHVTYSFAVRAVYGTVVSEPIRGIATPRPAPSAIPWLWLTSPTLLRAHVEWSQPTYLGSSAYLYRPAWFGYSWRLYSDDRETRTGWLSVYPGWPRELDLATRPGYSYVLKIMASNPYGNGPMRVVRWHT